MTVQGPVKKQRRDGMSHRGGEGTTGASEALFGSVSARRESGTQRANPGAPDSAISLVACAQGVQHPVGHRWGP